MCRATVHQMYSLVHLWQLALDSFGLCPIRVLAPFLEEVLFDPIRSETLSWPVAFESVILYVKDFSSDVRLQTSELQM